MALINCPECKKEISNNAKICPHCGNSINAETFAEIDILNNEAELNIQQNQSQTESLIKELKTEVKVKNDRLDTETIKTQNNIICVKCGYKLSPEFQHCPKCGKKADTLQKNNKKKLISIVLLSAAIIIGLISIFISLSEKNSNFSFKEQFDEFDNKIWCEFAKDDSFIIIDTNYFDIDDYFDDEALTAIMKINIRLGFSEAVHQKMLQTRSLDGRQQEENEKFIVSWTYHPDTGLEVMYERK
ncbi:MAG: zinc ribbon domain-containing protein [Clostridia bacterium]|nr:zinc ribbon domain-containing protein [Clostridia bacterium]